jgi:hypothetical protein
VESLAQGQTVTSHVTSTLNYHEVFMLFLSVFRKTLLTLSSFHNCIKLPSTISPPTTNELHNAILLKGIIINSMDETVVEIVQKKTKQNKYFGPYYNEKYCVVGLNSLCLGQQVI